MARTVARGEVRLYQFAPPDKTWPVVVLTRSASIEYLHRVAVAPVTSTIRSVPSEVSLDEADGMKQPCAINLHNVTTIDRRKLGRRVALLSEARMREVCSALAFALGCEG